MKIPLCPCGAKLFLRSGIPVNKFCPTCREEKKKEKFKKHKTTKTYQKSEYRKLHNKAWKLMSIKVRLGSADKNGMVQCYTCPAIKHWSQMDAGHHLHDRLDFSEKNIHSQCSQCNRYLHGNLARYSARLIRENGIDWYDQLEVEAKNTIYKTVDLIRIIQELQPQVDELLLKNNIPNICTPVQSADQQL